MSEFKNGDKVSFNLNLAKEADDLLTDLARRAHTTKVDIVRKGVLLAQLAIEAKEKGLSLGTVDDPEKLTTQIIGI